MENNVLPFTKEYELSITPSHKYVIERRDTGLIIGSYLYLIDAKKKCKQLNGTVDNELFHVLTINT